MAIALCDGMRIMAVNTFAMYLIFMPINYFQLEAL
jgi:hypothetical protein